MLGICADLLFYGHGIGVSLPIFIACGLVALGGVSIIEGRPGKANRWLGGVAISFAIWLAVRDEPMLAALNLLALIGLLLLLAISFRSDALYRLPPVRLVGRACLALFEIGIHPLILTFSQLRGLRVGRRQVRAMAPLARGLLLAAPLLLVFAGLLAAADSVFSSYVAQLLTLQLPFDAWTVIAHMIIIGSFAWVTAGGLIVAMAEGIPAVAALPAEGETERLDRNGLAWRFLGSTEALTVILLLDLLFAVFMAIQGAYLFGGLDTLARTGMGYAEYARRGFFELLTVACLALGLLCALALVTRRESAGRRRAFNASSTAMVLLVLGILASAFQRMWLYELAYGFTRLRLYTHSFMIWLAVVLLLFVVALISARPQIFLSGGFASALIYLTILNVVSPDALIVRENIARYQADPSALTISGSGGRLGSGEDVDLDYLFSLSSDAVPDLAAVLPLLNPTQRDLAMISLRTKRQSLEKEAAQGGWQDWHFGRARALAALRAATP
jgi:fumarate reductase subunit C